MDVSSEHSGRGKPKTKLKWFIVALMGAVGLLLVPVIVASTPLRDLVLQALIGNQDLRVTCGSASFAWSRPLTISDLKIRSLDGAVEIDIARVQTRDSLFAILLSSPNLGAVEIDQPHVVITVSDSQAIEETQSDQDVSQNFPLFSATVRDGSLLVRDHDADEPVVDADEIDLIVRIERRDGRAVLIVDPVQLVDHQNLTPDVCDRGLQLVAPALAGELELSGSYSLALETIQIDLANTTSIVTSASTLEGTVALHELEAGLKSDVTRRLVMMTAELMERGDMPDQIQLAKDVVVDFRLSDRGIEHDSMIILLPQDLPDLSIRTLGTVGWDEALDLSALIQVPAAGMDDTPLAARLAAEPLQLKVSGSIDEPTLYAPEDQLWYRELSKPHRGTDQALAQRILAVLKDLSTDVSDPAAQAAE